MRSLRLLPLPFLLVASMTAAAADEPPPGWHGSLGAGLSISSGNSDAKSYNLGLDLKYDPKAKNVLKLGALYLRSDANGTATADKVSAFVRDEYSLTDRAYVFGEVSFLRDKLALLDSLFAPAAGAGYKIVKEADMTFDVSAGFGGAFEKYENRGSTSSAALLAGETFTWKLSPAVSLTQKATGLWKTKDTGDAYYHFEAGLTTSLSKLLELKLSYLLDHKTRPVLDTLKKTDTALLATVVAKF